MNRDGIGYTGLTWPGLGRETAVDNRLDILGQIVDIALRLGPTEYAMNEALKLAVTHPTTLKVFMAPEFLY
jgi:hypothetical protein